MKSREATNPQHASVAATHELSRQVAASLATVAAAAGLVAFATFGAFDEGNVSFPRSVITHVEPAPSESE